MGKAVRKGPIFRIVCKDGVPYHLTSFSLKSAEELRDYLNNKHPWCSPHRVQKARHQYSGYRNLE